MEIHATRAWKIQSRAFVRRKKVGICIVSGFQVCWSLFNIEDVPTTYFSQVDATFEKSRKGRTILLWSKCAQVAVYVALVFRFHLRIKMRQRQSVSRLSLFVASAACGKDSHMTRVRKSRHTFCLTTVSMCLSRSLSLRCYGHVRRGMRRRRGRV